MNELTFDEIDDYLELSWQVENKENQKKLLDLLQDKSYNNCYKDIDWDKETKEIKDTGEVYISPDEPFINYPLNFEFPTKSQVKSKSQTIVEAVKIMMKVLVDASLKVPELSLGYRLE